MDFKASLDNLAKLVTVGVTIIFSGLIFGERFVDSGSNDLPHFLIGFFLLLIYGVAYAFSPQKYTVESGNLIIHRPVSNVSIPLENIKTVAISGALTMTNTLRTFGVGGLFGYYGLYRNFSIGTMQWYVTRTDRMVLLTLENNKKIVLSPDDTEAFIKTLV